jgi:hypothetical protein
MNPLEMIAPCGLDCAHCEIYRAAHNPETAERLAEAWRANGYPEAKAAWFRCQGCHGERGVCWSADCRLHACAVTERGLDYCSQCVDFPCGKLEIWAASAPHHAAAYGRLEEAHRTGETPRA